jgi:hypothetical protein
MGVLVVSDDVHCGVFKLEICSTTAFGKRDGGAFPCNPLPIERYNTWANPPLGFLHLDLFHSPLLPPRSPILQNATHQPCSGQRKLDATRSDWYVSLSTSSDNLLELSFPSQSLECTTFPQGEEDFMLP